MTDLQKKVFDEEYMPYIVKWGKLTCWISIPLILIPVAVLVIFFGAKLTMASFLAAWIPVISSWFAWYLVDPVTLFPVLHIPGLYMTYIAGNSKEIRAPASIAAMSAAGVDAGTEHGTAISCIAIATSVFVSITCMTIVAVLGNALLSVLPDQVVTSLNFLLPSLYGAMCTQRAMMDHKTFAAVVPVTILCVVCSQMGIFSHLPMGGGYAQVLILVLWGSFIAQVIHKKEIR